MRMSSIVIYNFSPPPSVIFYADGAKNDYLYLKERCFLPHPWGTSYGRLRRQKTLANLQSAIILFLWCTPRIAVREGYQNLK